MGVLPADEIAGHIALGELALDGALLPVAGVLPAAMGAAERGLGLICPAASGGEAAWAGSVEILAAPSLLALINHFKGAQVLSPPVPRVAGRGRRRRSRATSRARRPRSARSRWRRRADITC